MNITTKPYSQAAEIITSSLADQLAAGPVLLLLSGGSAATVYEQLARKLELKLAPNQLVVGLVDERYAPNPTHASTNDTAIRASNLIVHFEQLGATYSPILHGRSIEEEVAGYETQLKSYIKDEHRRVMAILGIGPDGHIAGILPDENVARFQHLFESEALVVGYHNDGPFPERITTTLTALRQFDQTIILVKDEAKLPLIRQVIDTANRLRNLMPATIVQELKNVIIAEPEARGT